MMSVLDIDRLFFIMMKDKEKLQSKKKSEKEGINNDPIVTEITPFKNFCPAENYHNGYYDRHYEASYCNFVIDPKIDKLFQKHELRKGRI